jgi:hypothetical protein
MNQAKQCWPVGSKGKADLPEAQRPCAALAANSCGPWVDGLQGNGLCGKISISAVLIYSHVVCFFKVFMRSLRLVFGYFFIKKTAKPS